jgi:hypothetical protein
MNTFFVRTLNSSSVRLLYKFLQAGMYSFPTQFILDYYFTFYTVVMLLEIRRLFSWFLGMKVMCLTLAITNDVEGPKFHE